MSDLYAAYIKPYEDKVRHAPLDLNARWALADNLCALGDYPRVLLHLQFIAKQDAGYTPTVYLYRELIKIEQIRNKVFYQQHLPELYPSEEPPAAWLEDLRHSRALPNASPEQFAAQMATLANAKTPAVTHSSQGCFTWISDADPRLGPTFELFYQGHYYWLALEHIQSIKLSPPKKMLDLFWTRVHITLKNHTQLEGYTPARYPFMADDTQLASMMDADLIKAKKTDWIQTPHRVEGIGHKNWLIDGQCYGLFDFELIELA